MRSAVADSIRWFNVRAFINQLPAAVHAALHRRSGIAMLLTEICKSWHPYIRFEIFSQPLQKNHFNAIKLTKEAFIVQC
jgi:hypothetical protein